MFFAPSILPAPINQFIESNTGKIAIKISLSQNQQCLIYLSVII